MTVNKITSLMDSASSVVKAVNPANTVKATTSFDSILNRAAGGNQNQGTKTGSMGDGTKQSFQDTMTEARTALEEKLGNTGAAGRQDKVKITDDGAERIGNALEKAVAEVKEVIKEELGVSDEELEEAMTKLGFVPVDLLDTVNVTAVVAELTGSDVFDILTDENLTVSVLNISSAIRDITAELVQGLDLTPEEFGEMLENGTLEKIVEEVLKETIDIDITEDDGKVFDDYLKKDEIHLTITDEDSTAEKGERVKEERPVEEKFQVTISDEEQETAGTKTETVSISIKPDRADGQPTAGGDKSENSTLEKFDTGMEKPVEETVKEEGTKDQGGQNFGQRNHENRSQTINLLFQNNLSDAITEAIGGKDAAEVSEAANQMSTAERVENILNQVKEEIKISIRQEVTSMELQLHPASLGKVGLHIEAKAGALTAQFVAENAQVKQALESQVTELKETLVNKGIRIEDVEVTLASHTFEQNFMNNTGSGSGRFSEDAEGAERSARLRRINLTGTGGDSENEEELSEADDLTRRIMIANGNSVDYSA